MTVPQEILKLIERFDNNRESYRSGTYNETQLRREFVDPFFKLLGWDVNNEKGYAEAYKDVIHEDSIKIGGVTKAPDYCFRIGGTRKFFVETKKPSVNLKDDISPAFQLRRYAWSAKLPLSILTDFEEFAVYDCRVKPDKSDKSSTARILYLTYTEYAQRWDEISQIFSRDAVLKGSFDRYAESTKVKKGTASVDDAFLKEIESWRDTLARTLALRNPGLNQHDLNFTVQRTIDRIVFLRICEDRGMEPYGRLMALQNGDRVYERLCEMFHRADERYNSGLFHFQKDKSRAESPDTLTLSLAIDDSVLKNIIKNLYYPDSPYEFSVISADILGQVYEQFLGKVIRLTAGHRAVVEEKPEVRKAGGVYYTPTYIVDYIVKNTVGQLVVPPSSPRLRGDKRGVEPLRNITPKQVSKLRILDPACGSGSFLLGAYQYLLDWHRDWYVADGPEKWATGRSPTLYQSGKSEIQTSTDRFETCLYSQIGDQKSETNNWHLTTAERKRILLNNIYGVDIDPQAVEVTKLSLLLKVLEGESEQTLARQLKLFHERALPDLGNNIKCGNSLIGTDFYTMNNVETGLKPVSTVDDDERYRINPFDWETEFPEIMKPAPARREQGSGGFDAVIGNPPYIRIQTMKEWAPLEVEHYKQCYAAASKGNYDIYVVFVERGIALLNKTGRLGFILPHKFFNAQFGEHIRHILSQKRAITEIVHFGAEQIFKNATTYTCLLFLSASPQDKFRFVSVKRLESPNEILSAINKTMPHPNYKETLLQQPSGSEWNFLVGGADTVLKKLRQQPLTLGDITRKIFVGLQTSADKIFALKVLAWRKQTVLCYSQLLEQKIELERELVKPFLMGKDVHRYEPPEPQNIVIFPYIIENGRAILMSQEILHEKFPMGWEYLLNNREALAKRERGKFKDNWWQYGRTQNLTEFEIVKIMTPDICNGPQLTIDESSALYHTTTIYSFVFEENLKDSPTYFLGVLNSKLLWFFLRSTGTILRGGFMRFKTEYLKPFPIHTINFSDSTDKARHDRMVALVNQMLELHKQLASAKTDHDKTVIQRQIDATDRQIDQLVYELYGLTEEEIKIVEEGST